MVSNGSQHALKGGHTDVVVTISVVTVSGIRKHEQACETELITAKSADLQADVIASKGITAAVDA